jgi:PIN domain nuclease of toxin-antitoxin system
VILLDTHVWLWWLSDPELLSEAAHASLESAQRGRAIRVSSISVWEVAMLVDRGRLRLRIPVEDWIARSEALPFVRFVPVDNAVALRSVNLPSRLHADPADRILAATALLLGCPLVTKDEKLQSYAAIDCIW